MDWDVYDYDDEPDGAMMAIGAVLLGLALALAMIPSITEGPEPDRMVSTKSAPSEEVRFATVDDIRKYHEEIGLRSQSSESEQ